MIFFVQRGVAAAAVRVLYAHGTGIPIAGATPDLLMIDAEVVQCFVPFQVLAPFAGSAIVVYIADHGWSPRAVMASSRLRF